MKKFYNEPEMAVKRFEAEDIVTASDPDLTGYATATGTLTRNGDSVTLDFIEFK